MSTPVFVTRAILSGDIETLRRAGRRGGQAREKVAKKPARLSRTVVSVLEQRPRVAFDPNAIRTGKDAAVKD
jgi:hypothetical protein